VLFWNLLKVPHVIFFRHTVVPRWPWDTWGILASMVARSRWALAQDKGDHATALAAAERAVSLLRTHAPESPFLSPAQLSLASSLRDLGRLEEAAAVYPSPSPTYRWLWVAASCAAAGHRVHARRAAELGLALPAADDATTIALATVASMNAADKPSAIAVLEATLGRVSLGEAAPLHSRLASDLRAVDRDDEALVHARLGMEGRPGASTELAANTMGLLLHGRGRHREAEAAFDRGGAAGLSWVGHQRVTHLGDLEGGLEPLRLGIAHLATDYESRGAELRARADRIKALLHLGRAEEALGETAEALERMREPPPPPKERWLPSQHELMLGITPLNEDEAPAPLDQADHHPRLLLLEGRALLGLGRTDDARRTLSAAREAGRGAIVRHPGEETVEQLATAIDGWSGCGACRTGDRAERDRCFAEVARSGVEWWSTEIAALHACPGDRASCGLVAATLARARAVDPEPEAAPSAAQ
jgi:tetratricopeptide (TPR) repeat protein